MQLITYIRNRWWLQCVLIWFSVFLALNVAGLVGARFFEPEENLVKDKNSLVALYQFPGIWLRWDAGYYLEIASEGYVEGKETAAFFPLYPLLIGFVHRMTNASINGIGLFISNASFLFSVLLLYKIARLVRDEHTFALRSVMAMLLFPTSFFFFALYAESIYLLFALLGVYLILHEQQFVRSGLVLGLSSIARPVGWLADVVLLCEFIRRRKYDLKSLIALSLGLFLSIIFVILYILYLYDALGTFMAIPQAQAHWPRQWQYPWSTYLGGIRTLMNMSLITENWFLYAINALDLALTSFVVLVIFISFLWAKRSQFPWSLAVYASVSLLFFLSSQNEFPVPLWGMSRWVASLFPLYLILGNMFKNPKLQMIYYGGSALFLIFFTAWWTSGRWIG